MTIWDADLAEKIILCLDGQLEAAARRCSAFIGRNAGHRKKAALNIHHCLHLLSVTCRDIGCD